jgi:hypothetical protein
MLPTDSKQLVALPEPNVNGLRAERGRSLARSAFDNTRGPERRDASAGGWEWAAAPPTLQPITLAPGPFVILIRLLLLIG